MSLIDIYTSKLSRSAHVKPKQVMMRDSMNVVKRKKRKNATGKVKMLDNSILWSLRYNRQQQWNHRNSVVYHKSKTKKSTKKPHITKSIKMDRSLKETLNSQNF